MEARDRAAATAGAILKFRRIRSEILPRELFAEPGWDLLLELFVADANGHRLTARAVSERDNIPPSVLSRWLIHLTQIGFIIGDGDGNLDDALTLSGEALDTIDSVMAKADELRESVE
ncbi:MAG: hypothetical protein EOO77_18120 [Oxalobacteraceae bacterium]|nr:MAG: hypothetical protein EOO77_18120 [Oxalobacteraceae bacterium]